MHYPKEYIQSLLTRFMQGETTLEEEDLLAAYFRDSADVPAGWQHYRQLFAELETLQEEPVATTARRRPLVRWAAAAAVAVVLAGFAVTQWRPAAPDTPDATLVAWQDTVLRPEAPNEELPPDSVALRRQLEKQHRPAPRQRRRIRKPEPTMTDYDRAYALMAEAEQERAEGAQALAEAKGEMLHARLTALGYIPVMQEDGTIIYVDKQTEYLAYEE